MSGAIHISTMRRMLATGKPVTLRVWTSKGEIQTWRNAVSLRFDQHSGTRNVKLMESREIRRVGDVCIFEINDNEVYL